MAATPSEHPRDDEAAVDPSPTDDAVRQADELEDGSLDPGELDAEPEWWDEGSGDEM